MALRQGRHENESERIALGLGKEVYAHENDRHTLYRNLANKLNKNSFYQPKEQARLQATSLTREDRGSDSNSN